MSTTPTLRTSGFPETNPLTEPATAFTSQLTPRAAGRMGATRTNLASPAEFTFTDTLIVFENSTVPSVSLATVNTNVPDKVPVALLKLYEGAIVTMYPGTK